MIPAVLFGCRNNQAWRTQASSRGQRSSPTPLPHFTGVEAELAEIETGRTVNSDRAGSRSERIDPKELEARIAPAAALRERNPRADRSLADHRRWFRTRPTSCGASPMRKIHSLIYLDDASTWLDGL